MALPLVIPNTVQVRLLHVIAGKGGVNVLHGIATGGLIVNQALAEQLGSAIKAAWTTHLGPLCTGASGLFRVGVRDIRLANQPEYLDTGATLAGTGTGDPLPPNIAICVTLRTGMSGKSFRGRTYIGGFSEVQNGAGAVAESTATAGAVAFMGAVDTAMEAAGLTLAVASRPAERYSINKTTFHADGTSTVEEIGKGAARAGVSTAVTVIQSRSSTWESQRRRNNERGGLPATFTPAATLTVR